MTEKTTKDEQLDISQDSNFLSPIIATRPLQFSKEAHFDLCSLSPIHFVETNLDQLWNDIPVNTTPKPMNSFGKVQPLVSLPYKNGLKDLSWKVRDIVEYLGAANYKEVADNLLSSIEISQTPSLAKENKNIRRRVYEALNILVAAGLIQKQGKKVLALATPNNDIRTHKEDPLAKKREILRSLAQNYVAMKNLCERNSLRTKTKETIPYPLIVLSVPIQAGYEISLAKNKGEVVAAVTVEGQFEVMSSKNILKRVGLHFQQPDIPKELKTLCRWI